MSVRKDLGLLNFKLLRVLIFNDYGMEVELMHFELRDYLEPVGTRKKRLWINSKVFG